MAEVEGNGAGPSASLLFLAGLGAGIALTVFLAPRSGAAMRRLIGRKVERGENWIKETASAVQDCARDHIGDLRDRVKDAAEVLTHG